MSLKSKLIRNLGANAYGQFITIIVQLASVPMFLHFWDVTLYGEWLILSAIPSYLNLCDIGFATVAANDMTMRVASGDKEGALEVYQSIWIFISTLSLVVIGVVSLLIFNVPLNKFFVIESISNEEAQYVLIILMIFVLAGLQAGILSAAFRAVGQYAYGAIINNTIRFSEWLFSIVVLALGGSVVDVAFGMLMVKLLGLIIMSFILTRNAKWLKLGFRYASNRKIKELLNPAVAFMAFPLGLSLSIQGMVLLIGMLLGSSAVVIFTAYRTATRFLVQMITMINHAVWPEISTAYGVGNISLVSKLYFKGVSAAFWISTVSIIAFGVTGELVIGVWTHHSFEHNHVLFAGMLLTAFLNVLWQTSWVLLMATNKHQRIAIIFITSAIFSLLATALVIPKFGLISVGVVLAVSELPLLFYVNNSALVLIGGKWSNYLKNISINPLKLMNI